MCSGDSKNLQNVPCLRSLVHMNYKDVILTGYKEFCKNFTEIENIIVIPKYLHDNEGLIVKDEMNGNSLDLNSYGYDHTRAHKGAPSPPSKKKKNKSIKERKKTFIKQANTLSNY